jgi:hypothetical protein
MHEAHDHPNQAGDRDESSLDTGESAHQHRGSEDREALEGVGRRAAGSRRATFELYRLNARVIVVSATVRLLALEVIDDAPDVRKQGAYEHTDEGNEHQILLMTSRSLVC